ncbi:hypothetical protein RRG08_030257 [Elysia crispata]|uniref:Uncharacterized protein n=1 Tax=Elysia crispata TaxID=231223 RepID=A0AAE1AJ19_9GAST|nr:hypothetical protein RRG08_030257 [Elysia crispata]
MTIPQGDSRGATSVSERRKVTFEGDHPAVGQQHPTTTNTTTTTSNTTTASSTTTTSISTAKAGHVAAGSSTYALTSSASSDSSTASSQLTTAASTATASVIGSYGAGTHSVNPAYDLTPEQEHGALTLHHICCKSSSIAQAQFSYHPTDGDTSLPRLHTSLDSYTKSQEDDKRLRQQANQLLNAVSSVGAGTSNATKSTFSVPSQDLQKSPLPLLNFFIPDDSLHSSSFSSSVSSFSDRSRKVSLNLPRPNKSQLLDSQCSDRVRRYSQPQKSAYQRVPSDDPSPTHNRFSSDFTLSSQVGGEEGEIGQASRQPQAIETHSHNAQVHATFGNIQDTSFGGACPVSSALPTTQAASPCSRRRVKLFVQLLKIPGRFDRQAAGLDQIRN